MLSAAPSYAQNSESVRPYSQYQPTVNYLNSRKAKWKNGPGGEYQAGPFTNVFSLRGDENNVPTIYLPGGPGSALNSGYKDYFDPTTTRLILSDWRGVGTSRADNLLTGNDTQGLVNDVDKMANIVAPDQKVILFGSSWGSTIAVAYALQNPEKIAGLVLNRLWLARQADTEWEYSSSGLAAQKYPEQYRSFRNYTGKTETADIVATYRDRLNDPDPALQQEAYLNWISWEWAINGDNFTAQDKEKALSPEIYAYGLTRAQIFTNYTANNYFFNKEGLLDIDGRIPDVPVIVTQNEFDPTHDPSSFGLMRDLLPNAEFIVQKNADWHFLYAAQMNATRSNYFIENAAAYGVKKVQNLYKEQQLVQD
ncbi:MAG TPA: alpha/beta fold hydrolase [Alphaproteobacteria bacterium]